MCGIFAVRDPQSRFLSDAMLDLADNAIAHRGPDGAGRFRRGPIALLHRRLALIDLQGGTQPMTGADGRYTIAFNGNIFNHDELRAELGGAAFRTRSDTEVLLRILERDGIEGLKDLRGEFAFVLHDSRDDSLLLARDLFGTKPIYWTLQGEVFAASSCIRALLGTGIVRATPDLETIDTYLSFLMYPQRKTFFRDIAALAPGSWLRIDSAGVRMGRFDSAEFEKGPAPSDEELRAAFETAVRRSLVADVPVGGYLSSGIDSSAVVCASSRMRQNFAAFVIGFDQNDERPAARATAAACGARLYEREIGDEVISRRLPHLIRHIETPRMGHFEVNDAAAGLAREHVTSVLSGGGGDEIFGGYTPHFLPGDPAEIQLRRFRTVLQPDAKHALYGDHMRAIAGVTVDGRNDRASDEIRGEVRRAVERSCATSELHAAMAFHADFYLPGLLMVDDAIAMSRALDLRLPFLDRDLVSASWRLSDEEHFDGRIGKVALRRALKGILPDTVAADPVKRGFGPPRDWMRGAAADWIRLMFDGEPACSGFMNPVAVRGVLEEHLSGRRNFSRRVWALLNLEIWTRIFLRGEVPESLANGEHT